MIFNNKNNQWKVMLRQDIKTEFIFPNFPPTKINKPYVLSIIQF